MRSFILWRRYLTITLELTYFRNWSSLAEVTEIIVSTSAIALEGKVMRGIERYDRTYIFFNDRTSEAKNDRLLSAFCESTGVIL